MITQAFKAPNPTGANNKEGTNRASETGSNLTPDRSPKLWEKLLDTGACVVHICIYVCSLGNKWMSTLGHPHHKLLGIAKPHKHQML